VIAAAIRSNRYLECYNSINCRNSIPFEMIFAGNSPPKEKMPNNFQYIFTEVGIPQCYEIAARAASGEYILNTTDDVFYCDRFLNRFDYYLSKLHMEKVLVGNRYQTNGIFYDKILTLNKRSPNSPVLSLLPAFKRSIWHDLGGIDRRFNFALFDVDMVLRFYEIGYTPFVMPDNWANEIRIGELQSKMCSLTERSGRKLINNLWMDGNMTVKNRREPVESFDNKDILTVDQNDFWLKRKRK
jgi:hypothetical protein